MSLFLFGLPGPAVTPLEVALAGAARLAALADAAGRFRYRYDARTGKDGSGYNLLRHCGAVWALLDVHHRTGQPAEAPAVAAHGMAWLLSRHLAEWDGRPCLVEENRIKLGGNALGALALLALHRATGEAAHLTLAQGLAESMLAERRPDGDFLHKRYLKSGKASDFRSEYYTGEALLALLALHEADGDPRWLDAAAASADALGPRDYGVAEQSHWMLYTLERLHFHRPEPRYALHGERIARHILDHPDYRSWGRSTPTACRSEGLLAFLSLLERRADPAQLALHRACLNAVRENLALQLAFRTPDGAFLRGGGDARRTEVRIDYLQHNISAFLHYHLGGY